MKSEKTEVGKRKNEKQMYKIGEFSKLTGLSIPALRYYDQIGVLSPEIKRPNGYRLYTGRQLFETQFISNMKSVGLSLEDIRYLIQHPQPEIILPRLEDLEHKLDAELRQIQNLEKYFRIGTEQGDTISSQNIEPSLLSETYALCTEIEAPHAEGIFGYHAQILQKRRDELGLRQHSGMRIIFQENAEETPGKKNLLICPVNTPETEEQKAAVQWFPKLKTVSCILRKEDVEYTEEIQKLREYLVCEGLEGIDRSAVAEGLLDPGDLPGQTMILVRLHLPYRS